MLVTRYGTTVKRNPRSGCLSLSMHCDKDLSETLSNYVEVQPTGASTGPEANVTGAPPFMEPIRSLTEPLPAWLYTCTE